MDTKELIEKYDLDALEVSEQGVYLHAGRELTHEEWLQLSDEISRLMEGVI